MELIKRIEKHIGVSPEKLYKTTLFHSENLLLGLNCLEPGQVQKVHAHDNQDKFYYVFEGSGRFFLGEAEVEAAVGEVVWAPAGMDHGVSNLSDTRLTLLIGIAPAP